MTAKRNIFILAALFAPLHLSAATYTYDEAGRLVSAIYDVGSQIIYEYDDAGNRTQVERDPLGVSTPVVAVDDAAITKEGFTPLETRL